MTRPSHLLRTLGLAMACAIGGSCTQMGDAWLSTAMSGAASNQIMLVREQPPSFGYQRLNSQSGVYPDLGFFVTEHGVPNFLAETGNRDRHYFILYYLKDREAFACRTRSGNNRAVEFAGPYPITDREFRVLDGFRRGSGPKPPKS